MGAEAMAIWYMPCSRRRGSKQGKFMKLALALLVLSFFSASAQADWMSYPDQSRLVIVVNKAERGTAPDAQTYEAYLDGQLLHRFIISTGKGEVVTIPPNERYPNGHSYLAETYEGFFKIHSRSRYHKSGKWGGADMPFANFFHGGIAFHETDHLDELGRRASGGCVRMHPRDARIMWDLVSQVGVEDTMVVVYDGSLRGHPLKVPGTVSLANH